MFGGGDSSPAPYGGGDDDGILMEGDIGGGIKLEVLSRRSACCLVSSWSCDDASSRAIARESCFITVLLDLKGNKIS